MKTIKFLALALVLSSTLTILSCSKDDDSASNQPAAEDCYTCTVASTKYCYTTGNSFYTITVGNMAPIQQPLPNGVTWAQIKASLQAACN
jgi:hypothetical protein